MRNQYEKQEKVLWYAQIMIFLGALAIVISIIFKTAG